MKGGRFEANCLLVGETDRYFVVNTTHLTSFGISRSLDPAVLERLNRGRESFDYFTSNAFYLVLSVAIIFLLTSAASAVADFLNRDQNKIMPKGGSRTTGTEAPPEIRPLVHKTKLRAFIELRNALKIIYIQAYNQKRLTRNVFYFAYLLNLHSITGLFIDSNADVIVPILLSIPIGLFFNIL